MSEVIVFNKDKTIEEYKNTPLFLGPEPGLFDTIHNPYPKVYDLFMEMKSLDWRHDEFDYSQCNIDFKTCPESMSEAMIIALAWQWEADSVASRSLIAAFAPFVSSSQLWEAWTRISDNENLHARTYSEIVRMSFDDPNKVLEKILSIQEAHIRMETVSKIFGDLRKLGAQYTLGLVENDQNLYNAVYKGVATLFMLERIQFMSSFAVTFTLCDTGYFQPIGKAVTKIAQDEFEVHCQLGREILRIENKTERGRIAREQCHDDLTKVFHEVVASEFAFIDYITKTRNLSIVGANDELLKNWSLIGAKDVAQELKIKSNHRFPSTNPMPNLEKWININKQQAAPQEQDLAAYKVGSIIDDDEDVVFDVTF